MNHSASDTWADCASSAFPTLDVDLLEERGERSEATKRVCIAVSEVPGPAGSGCTGIACDHLARLLAGRGHDVVIACVNGEAAGAKRMEEARVLYAGLGVAFESIAPSAGDESRVAARVAASTWPLYEWLRARARPFDIVHISDRHGLGYGPLLAKSLGLAFGVTHFVVHARCPTLWAAEGSGQLLSQERELGWVFMERRSIELADTVICGSAHLLGWMHEAGYALPARSFVWPYPFPAPDSSAETAAARDGVAMQEVVFFGPFEPSKGLVLFINAIERLVRRGRAPARITFLGRAPERFDGSGFIEASTGDWPVEVRTLTDFGDEEAVSYLSAPGRLAVLPSLWASESLALVECLQAGIPFLATAVGGTPELVASSDQAFALVRPDHIALGERIAELAAEPLRVVRPRRSFARTLEVWSHWHAQGAPFEAAAKRFAARARAAAAETPLVTVCIVHHERPELVRMTVDSVFDQDYPALEAVLVDDGSESAEALAALDALEVEFAERGWRVLRGENRHAGAARNTAAAAARGDWLLFLDDDNVLFPDAVTRLVRAARFSGAAGVPAASVGFLGDGDPRTETGSRRAPIRFLGAARFWNRLRNVAGDTCALVHRDAYEAAGGFPEEYGVWLQDMCFFNRLIRIGCRVEPMPDPTYYYRKRRPAPTKRDSWTEAATARMLAPCIKGLPADERAFAAYSATLTSVQRRFETARRSMAVRQGRIEALSKELGAARRGMAVRQGRIEALSKELEASWKAIAGREGRIETLSKELETARRGMAVRRGRIEALSKELGAARRGTAAREGRIEALSEELETSRKAIAGREGRIETLSKELETARRGMAMRKGRIEALSKELMVSRKGHVMALSHRGSRFASEIMKVNILLNPEWVDRARQWSRDEPILELHRNGRSVARVLARDLVDNTAQVSARRRAPVLGDALYSFHEVSTGKVLAALTASAFRRARGLVSAVENHPQAEVRGWILDPADSGRSRTVALLAEERLLEVVAADEQRNDIARWRGTKGRHGFRWRIPEGLAEKDGTRIDVFDAETGRPLSGSPVRIEGGRVIAGTRNGT